MTVLQTRIAGLGLAKQTVKGTGIGTPVYGMGVRSGSMIDVGVEQESDSISFSSRISADDNRLGVNPGVSLGTRLWPRSGPLLCYAALGAISSTGAGPYTHTITPGSDLPYLTIFTQLDTEYHKVVDCKVDELTISWEGRAPVEAEAVFKGITWTGYTASWTPTNDETGQTRYIPPSGTFKMDAASGTPLTAAITGGRIHVSNNIVPVPLSANVYPDDVAVALQEIEYELTLMPADSTEWRKAMTGSGAGTTASASAVYGSAEVFFTIDASNDIKFAATRVAFMGDYPEMDPGGGPAEFTMTGRVKKPAGAALTVTAHNQTASY